MAHLSLTAWTQTLNYSIYSFKDYFWLLQNRKLLQASCRHDQRYHPAVFVNLLAQLIIVISNKKTFSKQVRKYSYYRLYLLASSDQDAVCIVCPPVIFAWQYQYIDLQSHSWAGSLLPKVDRCCWERLKHILFIIPLFFPAQVSLSKPLQYSHGSLPRNTRISVPPDVSSPLHSPYHLQPIVSRISIPPSSPQSRPRKPIPLSVIMRLQNPHWGAMARVLEEEGDMGPYPPAVHFPREFMNQPVLHPPELRQPAIYSDGIALHTCAHTLTPSVFTGSVFI